MIGLSEKQRVAADGTEEVLACLPAGVRAAVRALGRQDLEEIRLRREGCCSATCGGENLPLALSLDVGALEELLLRLTGGSLYAHAATIRQGFLTLPCGARVGISGRAVWEGGDIAGIADVSSLVFRIPRSVRGCGDYPVSLLERDGFRRGLLLYSPPGAGKTTVLRDVCRQLSCRTPPLRVVVVDTRDEICRGEVFGTLDVLRGFSRAEGIEVAVRTLSPELLVCDEIGSEADADAILTLQRCGVPLLASAHADSPADLLARPATARLHAAGVFSRYVGLTRRGGTLTFRCDAARGSA